MPGETTNIRLLGTVEALEDDTTICVHHVYLTGRCEHGHLDPGAVGMAVDRARTPWPSWS